MDINATFSVLAPDPQNRPPADTHKVRRVERDTPAPAVEASQSLRTSADRDTLNQAKRFQQDSGYDQPQGKGQQAVGAYMSLEREAQRASIRDMLGVDIYA